MNLVYMKYAVEVASCGSINKAAESLYMDQSNLSRCIKELETSLGVNLFERSSRGIKVTPRGEEFLKYAKSILKQVDTVENMFRGDFSENKKFSVSVPRASYISDAFSSFIGTLPDEDKFEFFYKETNSLRAIKNILESDYRLGIIRYAEQYDSYYKELLDAKGLAYELVTEFRYRLLASKNSPLAAVNDVKFSDLLDKTEIAHADPYVPFLSLAEVKKEELPQTERRIFVFERGSQFDLLVNNRETYMWVSPIPDAMLARYHLVQRECPENSRRYLDVLIYREDLRLSETDRLFLDELEKAKSEFIG